MSEELKYYTTAQAARFLGISRIAVFKRIQKGQIKALKIGRNYSIPKEELAVPFGGTLSAEEKAALNRGVSRVVKEYGETLRLLGKE